MPRELELFVESAEQFVERLDESERPCIMTFMAYCKNCGEFISRNSVKNGLCAICQNPDYRDIRGSSPAALENLRSIKENFKNWGFEGDDENPGFEEEDDDDGGDEKEENEDEDQCDDETAPSKPRQTKSQARAKAPPQSSKSEPDYWANMDRYLDLRFDGE